MPLRCVPVKGARAETLVAVLHDAEEDDDRIRAALRDPACSAYAGLLDEAVVGAAVVRWGDRLPSELLYLAVTADERGRGYGRQLVDAILGELPTHGPTLLVGTATSALDNIAFYQKCGFRMYDVRPDHFAYIQPPIREHGIVMRDMVMFRYDLDEAVIRAGRSPMFCDIALAERIERAEAQLIDDSSAAAARRRPGGGGFVMAVGGGVASFAETDSPLNKVAGLGFDGLPDADTLDAVERAFAACGTPVQMELANLADPAIGEYLTGRGYRLVSYENVLGRPLDGAPPPAPAPGIAVRPVGDDEFEAWLDIVADAVAATDAQGVPSHEEFPRDIVVNAMRDMAEAGVRHYLATRDGAAAGGASLRIADGVAQMGGAATLAAHRHHGVHTALLATRLADAAAAGCDIAVVTTQPGSRSQQNVQRQGFDLLYTRAVLIKHPDRPLHQ